MIELTISNQTIRLLPQKAAFWVEEKALIVADIHLGKAAVMRWAGIAVPEGAMQEDLHELTYLIRATKAKRCIIVGDLIHAKRGLTENTVNMFADWLKNIDCQVELVIGNHDRGLVNFLPDEWQFHLHPESLIVEPFCFTHEPGAVKGYYVWSGHIHPQYTLVGGHDQLCLRCFQMFEDYAVLPAFSRFVGGANVKKRKGAKFARIFVTTGEEVIEV